MGNWVTTCALTIVHVLFDDVMLSRWRSCLSNITTNLVRTVERSTARRIAHNLRLMYTLLKRRQRHILHTHSTRYHLKYASSFFSSRANHTSKAWSYIKSITLHLLRIHSYLHFTIRGIIVEDIFSKQHSCINHIPFTVLHVIRRTVQTYDVYHHTFFFLNYDDCCSTKRGGAL